ncbi:MAG: ribosome small subunit-dependent GTPase A, partial [Anaerolineae bacterium]|nr:ribosome small subunit-dependent GTPase A [Anaerolineae bacterium]
MTNTLAGLVVQEQSGFFWVETPNGHVYMCRLRGRLLEQAQSADIAAIGDRVQITTVDATTGTIESGEPRKSILSRAMRTEGNRGAGAAEREQVIIANADQALFVFAAAQPVPSLRMLDRFLVIGEKSGIDDLVIVLNKVDLDEAAPNIERFELYRQIGYTVLHTSALRGEGISALRELLKDRISVFTGPSGVGKSSLLNEVQPGLARSVRSVSQARHEGLHTTRDSELVKLEFGGYLADTPGIRTLNIW